MSTPENLKYSEEHEWLKIEGDLAYVGITDFAQGELGDIVYVEIDYEVDEKVEKGETFGTVEAVKTVSELYMPVTGTIVEVNEKLEDASELVNQSPYEDGWIIKIRIEVQEEVDALLDAEAYKELIAS